MFVGVYSNFKGNYYTSVMEATLLECFCLPSEKESTPEG